MAGRPKNEAPSPAEIVLNVEQWNGIGSGARQSIIGMLPNKVEFADGTMVTNADAKKLAEFRSNLSAAIAPAVSRPLSVAKGAA